MKLDGMWENVETAFIFKIVSIPNCSDEYNWYYDFNGQEYTNSERVFIKFMETNKFAHVRSKVFDSPLLYVDNPNQIRIGNEVFKRQKTNPFEEVRFLA